MKAWQSFSSNLYVFVNLLAESCVLIEPLFFKNGHDRVECHPCVLHMYRAIVPTCVAQSYLRKVTGLLFYVFFPPENLNSKVSDVIFN